MAHPNAGTGTKTCQVQPHEDDNVQLLSGPSRSCLDEREATDVETTREEENQGLHDLTNESEPRQIIAVPRFYSNSLSESRDHGQKNRFGGNEAIAMLDSSAGGSTKGPSPSNETRTNTRKVTYASPTASPPHAGKGPLRQDSSYYSNKDMDSDGSEVDHDTQAKQLRARERIAIRRQRVQRTRRLLRACREKVHKFRDELRDVTDQLARRFNERKTLEQQFEESIEDLCEKLQNARDKLGPAEDEYDDLERKLDREEDDLEDEEESYYLQNDHFDISAPESRLDAPLSPLPEPSRPLDPDPEDFVFEHELVQVYLKKREEAEDLKEHMDDLENEYTETSGKAAFRKKHHIPLSEETTVFLYEEYPRLHAEITKDLRDAEDSLFEIRGECIEKGLFAASEYPYERWDTLCDDLMDLVEETRDRSPIRAAVGRLGYDDRTTDFGDKKDYVNKWILQWIEDSAVGTLTLEAWICFEYPDDRNKNEELGDERWSELAVDNWDSDQAGEAANKNNRESRLDTIAGINLGKLLRRHSTSTGRSGASGSLGTLDVVPDVEIVATFQLSLQHSRGFKYTQSSHEEISSTELLPKITPKLLASQKDSSEPLPTEQDAITYTADEVSLAVQNISIISTGEDTPSQSSYANTESRSNSISTTHFSDDGWGIRLFTPVTHVMRDDPLNVETSAVEYTDDATETPRRLPVDDQSEGLSLPKIPQMDLSQISDATQDSVISASSPHDGNESNDNDDKLKAKDESTTTTASHPSEHESPLHNNHVSSTSLPYLNTTSGFQTGGTMKPKITPITPITPTSIRTSDQQPDIELNEKLDFQTAGMIEPTMIPASIQTFDQQSDPIPTIITTTPPLTSQSDFASEDQEQRTIRPRAKSEVLTSPDRASLLASPQHPIRHRRSLSPTSFKFLDHTIRRIGSIGSLRHSDMS